MTKRCLIATLALLFAMSAVSAQDKKTVPPPPKPADEGPGLEVTMKFVADKISQQEKINYAVYAHDTSNNSDSVNELAYETTNVKATPVQCRMDYHRNITKNGQLQIRNDSSFELAAVQNVAVMTLEQAVNESDADNGHPARNSKVNPPAWVMRVRRGVDGTASGENVESYHISGNDFDVAITRNVVGGNYHYRLDFAAPPAKRMASSDFVQVYGFHATVTGNNPAPAIPTVTGHWLPGDPVHLEFDVVKQTTDFSQGWSLFLCIGTQSSCVPSPNLLEFSPPRVYEFLFRDEDMANRVAKAMTHAVELCGGGGKPEPF